MGWIEINCGDNSFINVDMSVIYRPPEPVNPLLWFGIFGNASLQRKPEDNDKLMCAYVLLAIIHDYELRYSGTPIDRRIFSADYKGKWFEQHKFCKDVWMYYHYEYQSPDMLHHPATAKEKLSQLNRALERVKAQNPAGTEKDITPTKRPGACNWVKGLFIELYGLTIERIIKAYLDKYG